MTHRTVQRLAISTRRLRKPYLNYTPAIIIFVVIIVRINSSTSSRNIVIDVVRGFLVSAALSDFYRKVITCASLKTRMIMNSEQTLRLRYGFISQRTR